MQYHKKVIQLSVLRVNNFLEMKFKNGRGGGGNNRLYAFLKKIPQMQLIHSLQKLSEVSRIQEAGSSFTVHEPSTP